MRNKTILNQSSSQVNVSLLNQFNLNKEERLIDDFSCGYIDKILNKGRMFISESNICFSCDLFGVTKKIKIPIRNIKQISKQRYFLIDNGIEIVYFIYNNQGECKEGKVLFTFYKRRIVFKRIKDLIISKHNLYASLCDDDIDNDDEEDEDDIDVDVENESYKLNKSNGKSEKETGKIKVKRVFNVSKYVQNKTNISSNTDINTNTSSSNSEKISKSLLFNQPKDIGYINLRKDSEFNNKNEKNENSTKINIENPLFPSKLTMTIEEIESVQLVIQGEIFEIPKFTISTSIQNFLRCFMGNNARFSQGEYSKTLNRKNVNVYDWFEYGEEDLNNSSVDIKMEEVRRIIENNKEKYKTKTISQDENHNKSLLFQCLNPNQTDPKPKPKTYIRLYEFVEKVENVPFVSETRIVKYQKLRQINNFFIFSSSTKSMDTPYNDYFTVDENWEVFPYQEDSIDKVIIRITYGLVFTKSTYLKSVLDKRVKENYEKDVKTMKDYFEEVSGFEVKSFSSTKQVGKQRQRDLKHGLEKDENKEEEGKEKKEKEEMKKRRNRMKMMRMVKEKDVFYLIFIFILVCYIAYLKDRV